MTTEANMDILKKQLNEEKLIAFLQENSTGRYHENNSEGLHFYKIEILDNIRFTNVKVLNYQGL